MQTAQGHSSCHQVCTQAAGKRWLTWPHLSWVTLVSQMALEVQTTCERQLHVCAPSQQSLAIMLILAHGLEK